MDTLNKTSVIYTTGAFLFPVKVTESNGNEVWLWAVSQFEDDSYCDGKTCSPVVSAETVENLLLSDEETI
jgi:hypothetical protein